MTDATDTPSDPSNPYGFPPKLVEAQKAAAEAFEELNRYQAKLPWSRDPHDGWEAPAPAHGGVLNGYSSSREPTTGWTDEQKAEYDRLWAQCRETSSIVLTHEHWENFEGPELIAARQALKKLPDALPGLTQDNMAKAV
ncbi:hypothetical protein KUF83_30300 [Streptomyces sp. BV286]|uniref:hypothetical protein n=1 Tax=Streptomyces sp. BV286 TaxID=2849672 RepID=UPI001C2F0B9B|nr:hypothetical protein [Streptomyces sp. BV286]MBV1940828.1 hypothetical protein [Streptomyces sp. BV286]